jgi:signal transduction histidine kinase
MTAYAAAATARVTLLPRVVARALRSRPLVWAAAYPLAAVATVAIIDAGPQYARGGLWRPVVWVDVAVGASLVAAAAVTHARRPRPAFAAPLAGLGVAWLMSEWNTPDAGLAFTPGLTLYLAWLPLLQLVALHGPDERPLSRAGRTVVAAAAVATLAILGLVSAAVFDAPRSGCLDCAADRLLVHADDAIWRWLQHVGLALSAATAALAAVLATVGLVRSSAARRLAAAPVVVPAVLALGAAATECVLAARRGYLTNDGVGRLCWAAEAVLLLGIAAGATWEVVRARRQRAALARVVLELGAYGRADAMERRLARALGDPEAVLVHARHGRSEWIDAAGRSVSVPSDSRDMTMIVAGGRPVSALVHSRGGSPAAQLVEDAAATARLALAHERLHALRQAELTDLRASRARIVETADAERRRLERDLHDGAQQRVVALTLAIRLLRRRLTDPTPALAAGLAAAEGELRLAAAELRELAHGLFPAALAEEGFGAAVEVLAERYPHLMIEQLPDQRPPARVESAAYLLVSDTARRMPADDIALQAALSDGRFVIELRAPTTFEPVPTELEDRVGAVGGTVTIDAGQLRAELPCEW